MSFIDDIIKDTVTKIDNIVNNELPIQAAQLAGVVFDSMGTEPTNRGWSENSENTNKKVGILGKFHRNVDTGELRDYAMQPGVILDDNWLLGSANPVGYVEANKLGEFEDIGRTEQDQEWILQRIAEQIKIGLSNG